MGLRKELAVAKEEAGNAEAELVLLKQELDKQKEKEGDSFVVASVMSSLGAKLEEKEREVMQKDKELTLLKLVENKTCSIDIHEKCLEDADNRAERFEKEKLELVKRLEAGAAHYRKLAAEKNTWEKAKLFQPSTIAEQYTAKIGSLENTIVELSSELRQARLGQDAQLSRISRAVSQNSSITINRDGHTIVSSISGESNMDSKKINNAVTTSHEVPTVKMPSLFHPFQPKPETPKTIVPDPFLPTPLMPENIDPTVLIPELQPREPAPYSSEVTSESVTPTSSNVSQL